MPRSGSQITLCDLPVRLDTYKGCTHNCAYCFTYRKYDIANIKFNEGPASLINFIKGQRVAETNWCDWDIPIHWGGLSDPFQPVEKKYRYSLECLKIFEQTQYPYIVSTKGDLIAETEYLNIIKSTNCVVQISAVCDKYDKIEIGAPTYRERISIAEKIAKHKRVIIRIQPYMINVFKDVLASLEDYAKIKVYGVVVEGLKYFSKKDGFIKINNDFVYPVRILKEQFEQIKSKAHKLGLRFYSGENRLRFMGDDLCCCGIDGMGWYTNKSNLNHYVFEGKIEYTDKMKEPNTGGVFRSGFFQETVKGREVFKRSYRDIMESLKVDRKYLNQFIE